MLTPFLSPRFLSNALGGSAAAALCAFSLPGAWAQSEPEEARSPFYLGAGVGFTHESNVLRASTQSQSDNWFSGTLIGGMSQHLGRQRISLDGTISENRYQDATSLNNTSYGLNAALDWEASRQVKGNLRYGLTQNLANQATAGLPSTGRRNSERSQLAAASANYEASSRATLQGSLQHRSLAYSEPSFVSRENNQDVASLGIVYGVSGYMTLGMGLRATRIDTPAYTPTAGDKTDRNDVDLSATWSPSSQSTFTGRLSIGKEEHTLATNSNFSGLTGMLAWDYRPTGRLRLNASLLRDTGTEARFMGFVGGTMPLAMEAYRLTNTAQANATYSVTGKINATASASHSRGSLVSGNVASGSDTVNSFVVGAAYNATHSLSLSCQLGRDSRSTNSFFSSAYTAYTAACFGRVTLR